jgi:molecular chaperone HscB
MDYFEFFGLEPRLALDAADLEERFYRLSRQLHPDRCARGTPAEQQRALEAAAELNDAYRTLRDPVARAEYVLRRRGMAECAAADPDLVEEMFELNMEREQGGEEFHARIAALLAEADARLTGLLPCCDEQPEALGKLRGALERRKYLARMKTAETKSAG